MPGDPGATVVTNARVYYTPRAAAGAADTRHSPRPLFSGRIVHAQLGRIARREREVMSEIGGLKNYLRRPGQANGSRERAPDDRLHASRDPSVSAMRSSRRHQCPCCAKLGPQLCLQQASVVMGPCVRRDDGNPRRLCEERPVHRSSTSEVGSDDAIHVFFLVALCRSGGSVLNYNRRHSGFARSLSSGRALRGPVGAPRNDEKYFNHPTTCHALPS
jgi:hypothetical protein